MTPYIAEALVKIVLVIFALMTAAAYLVLLERWIAAWIQDRLGPNRVGIPLTKIRLWGLGQPIADGGKFIFKEEVSPAQVDKALFLLAPVVIFAAAAGMFAVIPFGSILPATVGGEPIRLVVAPGVDVGMIYVFATSSLAVYGVILGSWASNDKYSFLGGMRSGAQLISYEIPLGLGLLGVVLSSGSLRLDEIIVQQAESGVWNVLVQPLGFVVFIVAAMAEAARLPFDLPECEQELVGGYHTEYSGLKLMMFLVAEFLHMVTAAVLIAILFLGGWHFWGLTGSSETLDGVSWLTAIVRVAVLMAKVMGLIFFFMVARWSWPRFRFDQLMRIAWQVMLPWGVVNVMVVALWTEYGDRLARAAGLSGPWLMAACGAAALGGCWLVTTLVDPTRSRNRPVRRDSRHRRQRTMNRDDKQIRWVDLPELGMAEKSYLPLFFQGLTTTLRHLVGRKRTIEFPEERYAMPDPIKYRGVHRLNRDAQGRVKCVACFLCATACPAHCIDIVAAESPWPDREKYPQSFTIDELRCIYCGMCEEACPVDAIELTSLFDLSGKSREEMIFDKEKLLSIYDQTKDREPTWSERNPTLNPMSPLALIPRCRAPALGLWLLLPRGGRRGRGAGALAAGLGLGLLASRLPGLGDWVSQSVFAVPAVVTVVSAAAAITFRNPLYCPLWFGLFADGHRGPVLHPGGSVSGRGHDRRLRRGDPGHVPLPLDVGRAGPRRATTG